MNGSRTRGQIVLRIVGLIDVMACWRYPKGTIEIPRALNERLGQSFCVRTVSRDLKALEEYRLVDRFGTGRTRAWKLNIKLSECHQKVGIKLFGP